MADHVGERIGQQFGNYRIERLLGKGGFAEVYLGEHIYLNTYTAIKILRAQLAQGEQGDFIHEARTIARLAHPNIVRVLDFGMQDDTPFLVMDYAPNGSLRDRHPKGSVLPPATIIPYVQQVAGALQHAHDEKLIHLDVKPENMLIGRNNEILLSDFGISSVVQSTQAQQTQEVVGTIPYMSPEQIQGKPRPASDQYALGVIVYEWLSGTRPFQGSFTEMYGQHLFTPPPPLQERNPAISDEIAHVVHIALAKDPHERFGSIRAFANALVQAIGSAEGEAPRTLLDITTRPAPASNTYAPNTLAHTLAASSHTLHTPAQQGIRTPQVHDATVPAHNASTSKFPRRTLLIALGGGAATLTAGGIAWFVTHPQLPKAGTTLISYKKHDEDVLTLAWSPDAQHIVSAGDDKTVQVWNPTDGTTEYTFREHTKTVKAVVWSPDGKRIASAGEDYTVYVWEPFDNLFGGTKRGHITTTYSGHAKKEYGSGVFTLRWSFDSKYIATASDDDRIHVWNANEVNKQAVQVYDKQKSLFGNGIDALAWSPSDYRIASSGNGSVNIWQAETGAIIFTNEKISNADILIWSPDGNQIASAASSGLKVWDTTAGAVQVEFEDTSNTIRALAWSPNGRFIATANDAGQVKIWDAKQTSNEKAITAPNKTYAVIAKDSNYNNLNTVAWASDSRRLAVGGEKKVLVVLVAVDE